MNKNTVELTLQEQIDQAQAELKALKAAYKEATKKEKKPLKGEMVRWTTKSGRQVEGHGVLYYYVTNPTDGNGPAMREATQAEIVKS